MEGLQSAGNEDPDSGHHEDSMDADKQNCKEGVIVPQHKTSSDTGSVKDKNKDESPKKCAIMPNQDVPEGVTDLRDDDIVFGRGKFSLNREGNIRMRKIIKKYRTQYQNINRRPVKNELLQIVYREIIGNGARFLRRNDDDNWEVVEKSVALKKVSQRLRDKRDESPSLFPSEVASRLMPSSLLAHAPQNHSFVSLPRSNLMPMQNPSIQNLRAAPKQGLGQGTRRGMVLCDPAGLTPETYALSSNINYHLLQREQQRQQMTQRAMLLLQMKEATDAAIGRLPNQRVPIQQSTKPSITKSDPQEKKEQSK
ncbi:MAG: hypothetical protein SGBAC_005461 [Bacillariaceae sp.]